MVVVGPGLKIGGFVVDGGAVAFFLLLESCPDSVTVRFPLLLITNCSRVIKGGIEGCQNVIYVPLTSPGYLRGRPGVALR